jgi:hypothetical protein
MGMKEITLTLPEIGLISGTRVAMGAALGLLIGEKLNRDQRKGAGWALLGFGVLSSVLLGLEVLGKKPGAERVRALVA